MPEPQTRPATDASVDRLIENMERVILGKRERIELVLIGMLAGGHILIEDIPGVGKSTLARALARSVAGEFRRIQFTPDLLPSDITGISVFDPTHREFKFQPGPIFANIVLADEINRTTPRTQSALLEAMSEAEVTVDGTTHALPAPFFVIATQNPLEYTGTYLLPESQLDRFLLRMRLDYPTQDEEKQILASRRTHDPLRDLEPVSTPEDVRALRAAVREIRVDDSVVHYLTTLIGATRTHEHLATGASPRATLGLYRAAQALAFVQGRDYVLPDDVKALAIPALAHRVLPRNASMTPDPDDLAAEVIREIVASVPVPL